MTRNQRGLLANCYKSGPLALPNTSVSGIIKECAESSVLFITAWLSVTSRVKSAKLSLSSKDTKNKRNTKKMYYQWVFLLVEY
jgi:hypothetical protein